MGKNMQSNSPGLPFPLPLNSTVHKKFTEDVTWIWTVIMHSCVLLPDCSGIANNTNNQGTDGEAMAIYNLSDHKDMS